MIRTIPNMARGSRASSEEESSFARADEGMWPYNNVPRAEIKKRYGFDVTDVILKATKVNGIYDADPMIVKDATMFDQITYMDVLQKGLRVMDATAISLCKDNNLPMIIFNLNVHGNIRRVITGERVGSLVTAE